MSFALPLGAQSPTASPFVSRNNVLPQTTTGPAVIPTASPQHEHSGEETAVALPFAQSSQSFIYRTVGDNALRLFMIKPSNKGKKGVWKQGGASPCIIVFSTTAWNKGTPRGSQFWVYPFGKYSTPPRYGVVGIIPDFRTKGRFNGTPEDCISDARAAVRWVQEHSYELGIDPAKVVCLGVDAGGVMAAWTAFPKKGPGKDDPGAPEKQPCGIILVSSIIDTKRLAKGSFGGSEQRAEAVSLLDQLPESMPPTLLLHGKADKISPFEDAESLKKQIKANGGDVDLVQIKNEKLGHNFFTKHADPSGDSFKQTTGEISKFITKKLGLVKEDTVKTKVKNALAKLKKTQKPGAKDDDSIDDDLNEEEEGGDDGGE